jgi:uncharacterized GH25 family protein
MRARETRVKSGGLRRPVHSAPALFFSLFVFTAGAANAHEYCLLPSAWNAMPGDTITFGAVVGEGFGGERKPYAPGRVVRLIARTARELDLTPVARAGDTVWARFTPVDRGGLLIACESNFATITLDAEKFDRYLADEGLDGPLASRRARRDSVPGRERYRRCAKTWLGGEAADRVTRPVGLPLEIVPLESPGTPNTGRPLRVKVLFEGRPLVGALLKAWRQSPGAAGNPHPEPGAQSVPIRSGRTDARGEAVVPAGPPGSYLISTVHMIASRVASAADWESTWASLTFGGGSDPR